jgi:hypothetical protein
MNERFFEVFQAIFGLAQRIRPSKTDKLRNFTGYFGYITAVSERSPRYKPANTRHPAQARDSFKIQWYANPKYLDISVEWYAKNPKFVKTLRISTILPTFSPLNGIQGPLQQGMHGMQ